ncbi:MAG TPA: hypothetical protein QGH10_18215, partial [Armatimonadota bacterium]|nr:hypothetical protein [Armatimonadota bacterium]
MVVALDVIRGSSAKYVTVNLNRQLAAELTERAGPLDLELNIIEDDAQNLRGHFDVGTFDCICFHHAMNDILQTAVATSRGMDTRTIDWWPTERTMIEWMAEEHQAHGLEKVGLPELRAILELSAEVLRPGGIMVFDHWTWEHHLGLDWFPGEL